MIATLAAMVLVTLIATVVLSWPWLRAATATGMRRRRANVLAYQGRLEEIRTELETGLIDAESAQALRLEAEQQLLDAGETTEAAAAPVPRRPLVTVVLGVALVLCAGLGYWLAGSWRLDQLIDIARQDPQAAEDRLVDGMVERLQARLAEAPDDAEGWAMLGRSYQVLGRPQQALDAYREANRRSAQPQADWLVAEGELVAALAPEHALTEGRPLFVRALELDPNHARALWFAGLASAQAQEYGEALDFWLRLRAQDLPPEIGALLDQRLPQLAQLAGRELPAAAAVSAVRLRVEVSISPELRSRLVPGLVLFVFARAEQGPPMPLAVQRIVSPDLPQTLTLDDSLAMTPELRLSQFDRWTVVARLSRSGTPQAQSGDIEGRLSVSREQAEGPLSLVLDRIVP